MAIEVASGAKLAGGRYVLERRLGVGGMATVWRARDERLERTVAVKILADALAGEEGYAERFRREARLAAGLSHPHLVSVFDFAAGDERPYLVMELVEGPTLAELLRRPRAGALDPMRLAHELLGALEHIHGASIIHRDVKPSNVLMGRDGRSRLTDFGVAQPPDATGLTAPGHVVGTARYLAPELLGGERASPRSDLYSCGVLLDEALAEDGDPALRALIARLTQRDPGRRPASAAQALTELEAGAARRAAPAADRTASTAPTAARIAPATAGTASTEHPTPPLADRGAPAAPTPAIPPARAPAPRSAPPQPHPLVRPVRGHRQARGRIAFALIAALVVIIIALVASSGPNGGPASSVRLGPPPPASAPLARQLDALQRAGHALAHR